MPVIASKKYRHCKQIILSLRAIAKQSTKNRLLRFLAKPRNDGIKFVIASDLKGAKQSILLIIKFLTNKIAWKLEIYLYTL